MKITIEIPDIEIYPYQDGEPTTFIQELRHGIRQEVVKIILSKSERAVDDAKALCESRIKSLEKELYKRIQEVGDEFKEKADRIIENMAEKIKEEK